VQGLSDDLTVQNTTSDNTKIVYIEESENRLVDFILYVIVHSAVLGLLLGIPYLLFYLLY